MDDPTASVLAHVDQTAAQLRDLVQMSRQHVAFGCEVPLPCPGPDVLAEIDDIEPDRLVDVLCMAVAELAALGYGETPAPLDLTDAGRAALAQPLPPHTPSPWPGPLPAPGGPQEGTQ